MSSRKSDGSSEVQSEGEDSKPELIQAAEDLLSAIAMKDAKAVAQALEAAYEICDSYEDDEHSNEDGE